MDNISKVKRLLKWYLLDEAQKLDSDCNAEVDIIVDLIKEYIDQEIFSLCESQAQFEQHVLQITSGLETAMKSHGADLHPGDAKTLQLEQENAMLLQLLTDIGNEVFLVDDNGRFVMFNSNVAERVNRALRL